MCYVFYYLIPVHILLNNMGGRYHMGLFKYQMLPLGWVAGGA